MIARTFFGIVLVMAVGMADRIVACGDKYLNLGLGTHYHRSAAERRSAGVLLYANTGSPLSDLLNALSVADAMKKAGYQPAMLMTTGDLDAALRKREWDVIFVDGRDTPAVMQHLQQPSAPHVVPVLSRPTKAELRQAEKTYDVVIDTPTRSRPFVDAVDDAIDLHEMEKAAAAKRARR
jgi:hypothetical protein